MSNYLKKVNKNPSLQQKKLVRDFLMGYFSKYSQITGLAGPHIDMYLNWCIEHKFKDIKVYEKDIAVLAEQLPKVQNTPISLVLGDISEESSKDDVFYDLDYCCTILSMEEQIKKYDKPNFIMTFSRRLVGNKTIEMFFQIRDEIIQAQKELFSPIKHTRYATNKGGYIYVPYFDSSAMCCIAKIN